MRYIHLKRPTAESEYYTDFQKWENKASEVLDELKNAPDMAARKKIIDKNKTLWGDFKQWLLSLSHQKCWFSEAKDCFTYWDVEHFRPKKSAKALDGTEYDGYWWLAFDWQNFRICGNVGNNKKGTYFPLRIESNRVNSPNSQLRSEDPILLDPSDADDPSLLFFNLEGRAIPAPDIDDDWDKERVKYSIQRYNLDFNPLVERRKAVWNNCWNQIQEYRQEIATCAASNGQDLVARHMIKEKAKAIRELVKVDQEFSAVARACIQSSGDSRIIRFL
jgi:uncharacterized protein (TIGR02646 family)